MTDDERVNHLLEEGRRLFNRGEYYDAHEAWEEMWSEINLPDRLFIQGIIQVTVSFYHLGTGNLRGSRNLMKRALDKLTNRGPNDGRWNSPKRGMDSTTFIKGIERCGREINAIDEPADFDWSLVPRLKPAKLAER